MNLVDLAKELGCELRGDGSVEVSRVRGLAEAGAGDLTFLANAKYLPLLESTRASAVIVTPAVPTRLPALLSDNPYLTFAHAVALLHARARPAGGVHPTAHVDPTATLGEDVSIGALCVVGPGVTIGPRTVLRPSVVVEDAVAIGADCLIHSGVQIRDGCQIGNRVIVQNGAVIGSDGFGFAKDREGRYHKIPQVGVVVVEDDVEIGALTAIDRAALGETRIGRGVKIDNLVQVGHSVSIGENTVMAGQVGIAGSTKIGRNVVLAGQVGVAGHLTVGDGVVATAQTGIASTVEAGRMVSGSPAIDNRSWLKSSVLFARLAELQKRVRDLEKGRGEEG